MPFANRLIFLGLLTVTVAGCGGSHLSDSDKWKEFKGYHPYLENGKETQNTQWSKEDWYVQDWTSQKDPQALVEGFFKSDILREQTYERGQRALIVGPNFYRLGGFDKRRVITTVDAHYGITDNGGIIILKDWKTKREIGVFTAEGLQIE